MKILSIDTTSNICGVSILEDDQLICQLDQITGKTHSENLMPMIQQAFEQANLTLNETDLLVCDKGPGSFTGIRIGVATIKAFHDSLGIPCIGVNSLEALAYGVKKEGFIASLLDCKNENCYFAFYQLQNSKYTEIISPTATTIENALTICQEKALSYSLPITFVGDGTIAYQEMITQKLKETHILLHFENHVLNSYCVGLVGYTKFRKNDLEDVLPFYLRKPQAQRHLEEKSKEVEISSMTQEDCNQIATILPSEFDDFWTDSILKEELNDKNSHYLVAKWNHEIIGFAGMKLMVDHADIMNIVVKKTFRNQGIGSLLLESLIDLFQKKNLSTLTLEVMEENYPAIHLYKKFGFQQIGIRKNYYQKKAALILRKEKKDIS